MIHCPPATAAVLSDLSKPAGKKLARSLAATRYIDFPQNRDDKGWRLRTSQAIKDGSTDTAAKLASWRKFALDLAGPEKEKSPRLLFARQQSRLLINMAGGVFENGGLSLDRVSGLPVIPGSAVKGCARRLALAALREWTTGQLQKGDAENLLAPAIEGFVDAADLLFHIALIFGWSDLKWQGREEFKTDKDWLAKRPDFAWACEEQWGTIRKTVVAKLCTHLRITPKKEHTNTPWKSLPHFAGTIAFLPAFPWDKDPGIDLDVLTCHHPEYYKEPKEPDLPQTDPKWQRWKRDHDTWQREWGTAPDTEEPKPVIFPAIAPGQTWVFLLHPTARAESTHLQLARRWLALGLETLGIGAKTNAGYGWFLPLELKSEVEVREARCLDDLKKLAKQALSRQQDKLAAEAAQARRLKEQADDAAAERAAAHAASRAAAEAAKTADDWQSEYAGLDYDHFIEVAKKFDAMTEVQRIGFTKVLASPAQKDTRKRWKTGKQQEMFRCWQEFAGSCSPPINI